MSDDEDQDFETGVCSLCDSTDHYSDMFFNTSINGISIEHMCNDCFCKWKCRLKGISDSWSFFIVAIFDSAKVRYIAGSTIEQLEQQLEDLKLSVETKVNWTVVKNDWTRTREMNEKLPLDILFWKEKCNRYYHLSVETQYKSKIKAKVKTKTKDSALVSTDRKEIEHYLVQQKILKMVQNIKIKDERALVNFYEQAQDQNEDVLDSPTTFRNWADIKSDILRYHTDYMYHSTAHSLRRQICKIGFTSTNKVDDRSFEQVYFGKHLESAISHLQTFADELGLSMSLMAPNLDGTTEECIDRLFKIKTESKTVAVIESKKRKPQTDLEETRPSKRPKTDSKERNMTIEEAIKFLDDACEAVIKDAQEAQKEHIKRQEQFELEAKQKAAEYERTRRYETTHELAIPALHLQTFSKCEPKTKYDFSIETLIKACDLKSRSCPRCSKVDSFVLVKWDREVRIYHGENDCTIPSTFDADCSTPDCGYKICARRCDRWVYQYY